SDDPCSFCDGRGFSLDHLPEICERCGGPGIVQRRRMLRSRLESCSTCEGRGFRVEEACVHCQGSGTGTGTRNIAIDIPPGVNSGRRLKVRGLGEPGRNDGPPGDCIVVLSVSEHAHLTRKGLDVVIKRPVTLFQALLGGWIRVPSLEGVVRLQLPSGTESGARLKMAGKGVMTPEGERGDQIVTIHVESPSDLSPEIAEALSHIAQDIDPETFPQTRVFEASLSPDGEEETS
ncbi:MAG: DnaJ C-terminal domain-containing protein, partial [Myxococcota bacterium]|nr:DnaJ C-terminal domain-containing protein [Myxococcota bacterium]